MSKRFIWSTALVALPIIAVVGSGIAPRAQAAPALVKTAAAQILVNAQGMTLYIFTTDKHDKSACTGACAQYWPPLLVPKGTKVAAALPGINGTLGVAQRGDGKQQLTYDGAPLYTFIKDKKQGDMTGQGAIGGTWWVVVVPAAGASPSQGNTGGSTPAPSGTPTPASTPAATGTAASHYGY